MSEHNKKDDLDAVRGVIKALESFNEDEQQRIIRWACEKLGISTSGITEAPSIIKEPTPVSSAAVGTILTETNNIPQRATTDIKAFVAEKNPRSDNHFAAVVAYYHQFEAPVQSRKDSITKDDLVEATRLAVYGRLKRPDQTLVNAMNAGLLDSTGSRGYYSLNSVGENLVAMTLPGETTGSVSSRNRKSKKAKKKTKKKSSKK